MKKEFIIEIEGENGAVAKAEVSAEQNIEVPIAMENPVKVRIREKNLKERIIDLAFSPCSLINETKKKGYNEAINDVLEILEDYNLS